MAVEIAEHPDGSVITLKVVPGSSRDRITGELGDALKITVAQAPQAGAANKAVIQLMADALKLPAKDLSIVRGHTSPRKHLLVKGMQPEALRSAVGAIIRIA